MGRLGTGLEDQRDSGVLPPMHLSRFGPQTPCFFTMAGRRENVPAWLAERSQFELVGPFCQGGFSRTR
jgi:hypothetical protein